MLDLFPINKCKFTGKKNHFSSKIEKYFPIQKNNIKNVKVLFTSNINRTVEYYTGMNFNLMVDIKKKKNTLLSGGRFDKLIGNLGSKNIPAVGAALNSDIL